MQKKILLLFFFICFAASGGSLYGSSPAAVRGLLRLNDWNFMQSGILKLSGEWEFYWDTLLLPETFADPQKKPVPEYVTVPMSWTGKKSASRSNKGYATYRLIIEMPSQQETFALRFYDIFSATRIWFDGKLIHSSGTVGTQKKASKPRFSYADVPVILNKSIQQHELIIQVSNFHHTRAGIVKPVSFGLFNHLAHQTKSLLVLNLIITGIILVIGLTHLNSYLLRPVLKSNLYFGLLCLVMILRNISTGERIITFLFPGLGWEFLFKLDNFSGFGTIPLFAAFLYLLYRDEFPKKVFYTLLGIGTLISVFVFVTPQVVYGKYRMFYELYILFGGLYLTFVVLLKAAFHQKEGALLTFIGFFVLYGTAINDVLISMGVVQTIEVAPFGLVFYMLTQSYILTRGSTLAMNENERLGHALQDEKQQLENHVEERTRELKQQNEENIRQKEELEAQGWFNNNLANLNNVLNLEKESLEVLCRKLLTEILSMLDACIGAIYLANEKNEGTILELTGSINVCREMLVKHDVLPGEGLVGACYKDQQVMHIPEVSDSYIKVTSGLGESVPRSILLVPLKTHNASIGVIEIASIRPILPNHIRLLEKAAENIASNLRLIQINSRNDQLLNNFREKDKELVQREEEFHQQFEELKALREQVDHYKNRN